MLPLDKTYFVWIGTQEGGFEELQMAFPPQGVSFCFGFGFGFVLVLFLVLFWFWFWFCFILGFVIGCFLIVLSPFFLTKQTERDNFNDTYWVPLCCRFCW